MRLNRLLLLLIAFGIAAPALADSHMPAPDIADTWIVVVKDGQDNEFVKAFNDHLKYRGRKGDKRAWKTYQPIVGDDLNHYVIRHCCSTYAGMDDYRAWSQKTKINDHWNENVDPYVADYKHYFVRIDVKNSNWPEDVSDYPLYGVTNWDQKSGAGASVSKSVTALSDAAKEGSWPRYWSWSNTIGGEGGLNIVTPYKNYADIETPDGGYGVWLAKQVGEDKAGEMLSSFSDNFHGSSYTLYRRIDEMSMKDMKNK